MEPTSKSFTLSADGLLRGIITDCGTCAAFNPLSGEKRPEIFKYKGLWDTGATGTVITRACADQMGIKPIGKVKAFNANGEAIVNVYAINIFLPNQVAFSFIRVTEGILNSFDILIGMDIISQGDFAITNLAGKTTFTFRIPSIEKIDFSVNK